MKGKNLRGSIFFRSSRSLGCVTRSLEETRAFHTEHQESCKCTFWWGSVKLLFFRRIFLLSVTVIRLFFVWAFNVTDFYFTNFYASEFYVSVFYVPVFYAPDFYVTYIYMYQTFTYHSFMDQIWKFAETIKNDHCAEINHCSCGASFGTKMHTPGMWY